MKTLIVDDEAVNCEILRNLVQAYGAYDIAANGKEALAKFASALDANNPYDVVLLDIMMPEMDGQQALRELRALEAKRGIVDDARTKVIMVTCLDDQENFMSAQSSGVEWYVAKPVQRAKFIALLKDMELIPR